MSEAEQEQEERSDVDYANAKDEYKDKRGAVDAAADMVESKFWKDGFKSRRVLFDKTLGALAEEVVENSPEDYDGLEDMKALDKAKLAYTKAARDFDNYVSDVQTAVDALHKFCTQEDLPLFKEIQFMTASFSRKTGKISSKKAK